MIDPAAFRHVLGHYPTGVCAITATLPDGGRAAMIVGSFTSVSLDPPLVGFLPGKDSRSWPLIEESGRFCVTILASHQRENCRRLGRTDGDKYEDIGFRLSDEGSPVLDGAIAWIDCAVERVVDAGDHYFVLGRVLSLASGDDAADPMLFYRGRYGGFAELYDMPADG